MLRKLSIQNFILIDTLELDFAENFTSITGETGSGKSILLGALNLIKGDRADYNVIGPNGDKSIVEAHFDMPSDLTSIFEVLDLEIWEELILRREIQKNGKSRSFVNDTPVSLQQLKEISQHLMAIHSQYNTLELKEKNYQLFLLDVLAGTLDESTRYKVDFLSHKNMLKELAQLKTQLQIDSAKQDYESFILAEIQGLDLEHTSYKSLEEKLNFQEKRQELLSICTDLYAFTEHESTASLPVIKSHLEKLAVHDKELEFLIQYVDSLQSSLKEIAYLTTKKMEVYSESTGEDVQLLSRVDDFNRLLNKHRLQNEEELLLLKQTLENNRTGIDELSDRIVSLEATSQVMQQTLLRQATSLNEARIKALPRIHQDFAANLNALKLKDAKLTFQLVQHENLHENLNENGGVEMHLLFSANQGVSPVPIEKAASGGELSRVMLVLQKIVSQKLSLPSILFDEVDTGVSGDVAEKMGIMLYEMGKNRQLFAITHLPQVAAQAEHQFKVIKTQEGGKTKTKVISLSSEERIHEIARLMSGEIVTQEAVSAAKSLMRNT